MAFGFENSPRAAGPILAYYSMRRAKMFRASLVALALSLLVAGEARAGLIFTQTACGGIGESPCTVVQSYHPALNAAPLDNQAFRDFFAGIPEGSNGSYVHGEVGSNADYSFGHVLDSNIFIDTYYINGAAGPRTIGGLPTLFYNPALFFEPLKRGATFGARRWGRAGERPRPHPAPAIAAQSWRRWFRARRFSSTWVSDRTLACGRLVYMSR